MSTSKKTVSLNKRLAKKYALLKLIFPTLSIKALIVLTKGSTGLRSFPSYCTVWVTKDFDDEELLEKIIYAKRVKNNVKTLKAPYHKKFIEACHVRYKKFQYFPTLQWILEKSRAHKYFKVDLKFFSSSKLSLYFDLYTKLYIGYILTEDFLKIYPNFNYEVKTNRIIVTIEKVNQTQLDLVYYAKLTNKVLKRIRFMENDEISIKEKQADGFTNAEVRFFMNVLEEKHALNEYDLNHVYKNINLIKY